MFILKKATRDNVKAKGLKTRIATLYIPSVLCLIGPYDRNNVNY